MCWREKQIPISFRTSSLTQLISEAPEDGGGCIALPGLSPLCILPCPSVQAVYESQGSGSREERSKGQGRDIPSLRALFCITLTK